MNKSLQGLVKYLSTKYPKISEILNKTGIAEFDNKRNVSYFTSVKTKNDVAHCFGIVHDLAEQAASNHFQNDSENTSWQAEVSSYAPWNIMPRQMFLSSTMIFMLFMVQAWSAKDALWHRMFISKSSFIRRTLVF